MILMTTCGGGAAETDVATDKNRNMHVARKVWIFRPSIKTDLGSDETGITGNLIHTLLTMKPILLSAGLLNVMRYWGPAKTIPFSDLYV
jgi:hypothetical protein